MSLGRQLAACLADPHRAGALDPAAWTALISAARTSSLAGSLAERCQDIELPEGVARVLADIRAATDANRRQALWEARCCRVALAEYPGRIVLLKGTAYAAAGLPAADGRTIGDLDILVAQADLDRVAGLLQAAGWEWAKPDPYDDAYYRRWMHELPPLIHRERDRLIDVHHTILPLTARPRPDAAALLADAVPLGDGLWTLHPADMLSHAAAHLIADGDLSGGLRNLWDIDRLWRHFSETLPDFAETAIARAEHHGLAAALQRALRLAHRLYETPVDPPIMGRWRVSDALFAARVTAIDGWGQRTRKLLRRGFYIRSHLLRMPVPMLARHLAIKLWRGHRG